MQIIIWLATVYFLYRFAVRIIADKREYAVVYGIFSIWWMVFILLAMPEVVNTYSLSVKTVALLCLGTTFFSFGYLAFVYYRVKISTNFSNGQFLDSLKKADLRLRENLKEYAIDFRKLFFFVQVFLFVLFVLYYKRYIALLEIHGVEMTRLIKFELGLLFRSTIEAMIFQYVLTALLYVSIYYYLTNLFEKRSIQIESALLVVNVVLYSLIGQGRFIYFNIILLVVILFANIMIYEPRMIRKYLIPVGGALLVLVVCLFAMTLLRMGAGFSNMMDYLGRILFQVYCYFTGGFKGLQQLMNSSLENYNFIPGHFTFTVLIDPFYSVLSKLGLNIGFDDPMVFLQQPVFISQYTETNALFTYYINFYLDFSYLGFIIMPFFIGWFAAFCVKLSQKKSISLRMLAYSNLLHLLNGVLRWEYQAFDIVVSVLLILILSYFEPQEK